MTEWEENGGGNGEEQEVEWLGRILISGVCGCDGESRGGRGRSVTLQVKPGWVSFSFLLQKKKNPLRKWRRRRQ